MEIPWILHFCFCDLYTALHDDVLMMALGFSTALVFLFAFVVSFVSTQNTSDTAAILQQLQENLPKCAVSLTFSSALSQQPH